MNVSELLKFRDSRMLHTISIAFLRTRGDMSCNRSSNKFMWSSRLNLDTFDPVLLIMQLIISRALYLVEAFLEQVSNSSLSSIHSITDSPYSFWVSFGFEIYLSSVSLIHSRALFLIEVNGLSSKIKNELLMYLICSLSSIFNIYFW